MICDNCSSATDLCFCSSACAARAEAKPTFDTFRALRPMARHVLLGGGYYRVHVCRCGSAVACRAPYCEASDRLVACDACEPLKGGGGRVCATCGSRKWTDLDGCGKTQCDVCGRLVDTV